MHALFEAAQAVQAQAYAPYSAYAVGAAILGRGGQIYAAANVENAAYPLGTCAEAGAISAMITGGCKAIEAVCIIGTGDSLVSPCGGCRQRLREFAGQDVPVHLANAEGIQQSTTVGALLPLSFGPEHLSGG